MTCKYNYKSVSLKVDTYSKLNDLTSSMQPGKILSKAKVVDKLISNSHDNSRANATGVANDQNTEKA